MCKHSKCFLLKIIDTIEPEVITCDSPEQRLQLAKEHRENDPDKNDALFKIDMVNCIPEVTSFSGSELDTL